MADATLEALTRAIYGQESGSGSADTAQPNYAGARGPMQITAPTFEGMKAQGLIPKEYDHANPEHSKDAGEKLVSHLYAKYGNDPRKAAAAYYAGDKAIQSDGSIKDYRDLKNDRAPTTLQYVDQVIKRMGGSSEALPVPSAASTRAPVLSSWDEAMPGRSSKATGTAKIPALFLPASQPLSSTSVLLESDMLDAEEAALRAKQQVAQDTSFMDSSRAAFMHQGMGAVIKSLVRPDYEPVPGFTMDPKRLASLDSSEQEFLKEAVSEDHAKRIEWEIQQRREDLETVNINGTGIGIAASLFAGLPEGYLMGMGAMRALQLAKLGSATLSASGRTGAAIASSVAENVGVNVLATAVQDKFDPYVGAADYAMAVAGGGLGVALTAPSLFKAGAHLEAQEVMETMAHSSAKATQSVRERAVANVGPDAPAEHLTAEAARLEGNQARQEVSAADAGLPEHRRLLPEVEEAKAETTPAEPPKAEVKPKVEKAPLEGVNTKLSDVLDAYKVALTAGEKSQAYSKARRITIAYAPEADFMAAHGNSLDDVIAHEFSHVFWGGATALPNFKDPNNRTLLKELKASSKEFRPSVWEKHPKHAGSADELLADALAKWMKDPKGRSKYPLIDKMVRGYDAGTLAKHFPDDGTGVHFDLPEGMGKWADPQFQQNRIEAASIAGSPQANSIKAMTRGAMDNLDQVSRLKEGVTALPDIKAEPVLGAAVNAAEELTARFLKGSRVVLSTVTTLADATGTRARGQVTSLGKVHFIGINPANTLPDRAVRAVVHEVGHAVGHEHLKDIPPSILQRMVKDYEAFRAKLDAGDATAREKRQSATSLDQLNTDPMKANDYNKSFDEYLAEQFVKHIEQDASGSNTLGLGKQMVAAFSRLVRAVLDLFGFAKTRRMLEAGDGFSDFFEAVLKGNLKELKAAELASIELRDGAIPVGQVVEGDFDPSMFNFDKPEESFKNITNSKVAQRHGLDLLPIDTPQQRADAKALVDLYKKAEAGDYKADPARLSKLMNTAVFQGGQSTANTLLQSNNPVARMVAAELLESPSGAAGRRNNAAIKKFLEERRYLGNTLNEFQDTYKAFRNAQGGNAIGDFFDGRLWEQFNRLVAEEIEARRSGVEVQSAPAVRAGADALEGAYERMRVAQQGAKTTGWASLPATSRGYMPHRMSPEKVRNMTTAQARALHSALTDQFISIEGFDMSFSDALAAKYVDRVRRRALGGFDTPAGIHQVGAADVVQDALESMGMSREEVLATMQRYMAAGPGYTKKRLKLDLNAEYDAGDGNTFRLMDLFETDQFRLLRSQSKRVSGEVALSRHGVMGKSGLALLRRAMEFGADGEKVQAHELEAFDQVAAEFLGDPFGTQSKLVDRVMQANSLSRLGGMGFTQFAEAINGLFHVGALRTLDAVSGIMRLRGEIKALAKGEKVNNPILGSLEKFGGAEFGTDQYKTVFPFDNQSLEYQTYGQDTLTAGDRLLRGGAFVQGKMSLWRSIHSAQQRGFAEQVVRKAAQFIKDGTSDAALRDMGIDDTLIDKLREDLGSIAKFDAAGKLTDFDITKARDVHAAEDFTQAVHRGVSQIIQGTFIGEQGRWVHDGMMRLVTQFRTFSLTSIEKQWARQVGNVGTAKTLGMMLGAMSMAAPVYMARTYLASVGRTDQEEYLEKQLSPAQIARASLNYIALSGLAGDFLDATTAVTGIGTVTGGRTGVGKEFVGNVVAPAAGLVDDIWRGVQNTKEGTDPHELVKALPFSRLPWLIPAINALGD